MARKHIPLTKRAFNQLNIRRFFGGYQGGKEVRCFFPDKSKSHAIITINYQFPDAYFKKVYIVSKDWKIRKIFDVSEGDVFEKPKQRVPKKSK